MSEERRAVPISTPLEGGPSASSFAPSATADIGSATPAPRDVATSPPASIAPREASAARRRLSLRIPDDEITRPNQVADDRPGQSDRPPPPKPAIPDTPSYVPSQGVLKPMRIITINAEPGPTSEPLPPPSEPPTQPTLVRDDTDRPSTPELPPRSDSMVTTPRTPAPLEADEVEVRFDDDALPIALKPVTPVSPSPERLIVDVSAGNEREHRSDPPPEVAAEDLFTIDPSDERLDGRGAPIRPAAPSQPPLPRPAKRAGGGVVRSPLVIVPPHVGSIPSHPTDSSGARRKGRLWWEDLFNDDYVRATEKVTDEYIGREVHFIEESLGVERGGALLDLACGAGRHAVELARQGYEVVGFDLSLAMLARAGEEAQDRQAKLNFVQGDMREMAFDEQFDGVYCWNTSFGYFEEDKNAQVIDRVHRALKGGGLFLLDVINRDFLVRQSPSLAWFEGDGCVCMDEMSLDFITSRMKVKRTMMLDDGRSREIEYTIRVYSLYELGKVLHEHGFKVREVSGGLAAPGVFFGSESPRVIVLAEKR